MANQLTFTGCARHCRSAVLDNKVVSVLRAQAASVAPAIQKILPTFPSSKVPCQIC